MKPLYPFGLVLIVGALLLAACGSKKPPPSGMNTFLERYETLYAARDRGNLLQLVDWPAVDEELRPLTKEYVYPYAGEVKIESIEAVAYEPATDDPTEFEGKAIVPSPEPTHRVRITFEPEHAHADPEPLDILVVERDGVVNLCGWAYAE